MIQLLITEYFFVRDCDIILPHSGVDHVIAIGDVYTQTCI